MAKTHPILLYAFCLLCILSCSSDENKSIAVYKVFPKNFENTITIEGFVEPVRSTMLVCPRNTDGVVAFLVEDGTYVQEGDTVCIVEMQELQTQYDMLVIDLENAQAGLEKTKAELQMQYALLEAQVENNEADTKIAQMDSLQLAYSAPNQRKITQLELEKVTIEKNRYEKKLDALSVIQQSDVRKVELEIQQLANRVKSSKDQLDALTVKATRSGLAIRPIYPITRNPLQVGDPVWTNMPLVNIPDMSEMKVKIRASESDYKYISVNDTVLYTFDAMPGNMAYGKIVQKSPVGQPYKEASKVKFFELEASIDSMLTIPEPGFTANCRIILQQVKDTLVVPQIAVFEEDSIKVVYIKKNKGYEMRQVLTGLSSPKETIITAGLESEDLISLAKPEARLIKQRTMLTDSNLKPAK